MSYATPHEKKSVATAGRVMAPDVAAAPLQLALPVAYHLTCGRSCSAFVKAMLRPTRDTVALRMGHAADASVPPKGPTATGVDDADGVGDGVGVDEGDTYARFHTVPPESEKSSPPSAAMAGELLMAARVPSV